MRRTLLILALVSAPLLGAAPAAAHVCAQPVSVEVGEPASLTVGLGAETSAVVAVEVELPEGFRLSDASGEGWEVDVRDDSVRFSGRSVAPFACGYVTLRGVAEERATLLFPLVMETDDGRSVTYDHPDPFREDSGLLVYAGVTMPSGLADGNQDQGPEPVEIAGWVLVAGGSLLVAALGIGRWRRRGTTPDAVQNKGS
jgi:hypothetical protein